MDYEVPTPPDLTNRPVPTVIDPDAVESAVDLRRDELEAILREGAWQEAFDEWAEYTDLTEADLRRAADLDLFQAFDFFWDGEAERLRYETPAIPADWGGVVGESLTPAGVVGTELDDLGRIVAETIASRYVDWGSEEPADLVWSVDTFGQVPTGEE